MVREGLTEEDKKKLFKESAVKPALYALRRAKQRCPVDTGRLRASLTVADSEGVIQPTGSEAFEGDGVDPTDREYTVVIGTNVEYASYVFRGTVNQSPQPTLRPAVDDAFNRFNIERT